MFGFNEAELRELILETIDIEACKLTLEDAIADIKENYRGYRFSARSPETVFNPTACLYYLRSLKTTFNRSVTLLDSNLGLDLSKIERVLNLGDFEFVKKTLEEALNHIPIDFKSAPSDLDFNRKESLDEEAVLSFLFYLGFLTFDEKKEDSLVIANRTIQDQFIAYFLKRHIPTR